jgi:hypothetical protein
MQTFMHCAASVKMGSEPPNAHAASSSEMAQQNRSLAIWSKPLIFSRLVQSAVIRISGADVRAKSSEYGL